MGLGLFDLDGTLVDSAPDLAVALDEALQEHGHPPVGERAVRGFVGEGAGRLVHRALTGDMQADAADGAFKPVFARFLEIYAEGVCVKSRLYPGVDKTLTRLVAGGWRLAIVTNKPVRFVEPLLRSLGVVDRFATIVGGDSLARKKPDPLPIRHILQTSGFSPAQAVMVGDSVTDLRAARAAGVDAVCVTYGYGGSIDFAQAGARHVIDRFEALENLLLGPQAINMQR